MAALRIINYLSTRLMFYILSTMLLHKLLRRWLFAGKHSIGLHFVCCFPLGGKSTCCQSFGLANAFVKCVVDVRKSDCVWSVCNLIFVNPINHQSVYLTPSRCILTVTFEQFKQDNAVDHSFWIKIHAGRVCTQAFVKTSTAEVSVGHIIFAATFILSLPSMFGGQCTWQSCAYRCGSS